MLTEQTPLWDEAISNMLVEEQQILDAPLNLEKLQELAVSHAIRLGDIIETLFLICLLYTSPSPRDRQKSRMPSSA